MAQSGIFGKVVWPCGKNMDLVVEDLYVCACLFPYLPCDFQSVIYLLSFSFLLWKTRTITPLSLPKTIAVTTKLFSSITVLNSRLETSVGNCYWGLDGYSKVSPCKWNFTFPDFTRTSKFLFSWIQQLLSFHLPHFHSLRDHRKWLRACCCHFDISFS